MHLEDYLRAHAMTQVQFAEWLGVTRQMVHAWIRGTRVPSDKLKAIIYEKTRGEIEPNDWFHLSRIRDRKRTG